ncbi:YtxH domain-containing protein [Ferviditalea candida]|uniref:YtxH domain-containing protein n=1 Tax=Ferviditalea candida TaxID=3108399 RepID=A0ABU5ZK96_9BACL|nr:YtxH domain-containing protein [Paenibacillaceae bacterium T2]
MGIFISEKRRRQELRRNTLKGVAIGTVLGGIAAVLLTPVNGREARQKLVESSKKVMDETSGLIQEGMAHISRKSKYGNHQTEMDEQIKSGISGDEK